MVAKQQEVLDKLRSGDRSIRLKAVRDIKNQIIGNKSKKLSYIKLQAVPEVVALLQDCADAHLLVQSAAAVGSFAYGVEAGRQAVLASGGVKYLLHAISSQDASVVEAALRALKLVWQVMDAYSEACLCLPSLNVDKRFADGSVLPSCPAWPARSTGIGAPCQSLVIQQQPNIPDGSASSC